MMQLNKIIGFCITNRQCEYDFKFAKYFPWIVFAKMVIGDKTIWLWGHGDIASFVKRHTDCYKIIAGYTSCEMDFLSTDIPENRAAFITIYNDRVEVANDTIGCFRVFYGKDESSWCISSNEDLVLQTIDYSLPDKTNLVQYMLFGHLTGEQTIYSNVFSMPGNSRLTLNHQGFKTTALEPLSFGNISNPVETLHKLTDTTIRKYTDCYDRMFLPLSGGYDSRMLAAYMQRPERIIARTYDYAYPLEIGFEVTRAGQIAEAAGIKNWQPCDLGTDFYADYARRWYDVFGTSTHLHGMYVMSFFEKSFGTTGSVLPTASGYICGAVLGSPLEIYQKVQRRDDITKFCIAQSSGSIGFGRSELAGLLNYDIEEHLPVIFNRWQNYWQQAEGNDWQKFMLNFIRQRSRTHISYLCTLADLYGAAITPFVDRNYIQTTLSFDFNALLDRRTQKQVFETYYPEFCINKPAGQYRHCINFLCMKNRKLDSIPPITSAGRLNSYPYFREDYLQSMLREYLEIANSPEIIYNNHEKIKSLYRFNVLQPLFFAYQQNESLAYQV